MIKEFRYHIVIFVCMVSGLVVLQSLLKSHEKDVELHEVDKLNKVHSEAVLKVKSGINIYATVVSSIRAFIENSNKFPTEIQLHNFLKDLIKEVDFKDSIIVSWVDTNQIFQYVVTPYQIDPNGLKGIDVNDLRPEFEINRLNALMYQDKISLFNPINLKEGWAAFPFNFSARKPDGTVLGYIAPVVNVKYLLNYTYSGGVESDFVHKFIVDDDIVLTREVVYDGTTVYNEIRDSELFSNFNVNEDFFINTDIDLFGLKLTVGTAYKKQQKRDMSLALITYLWFGVLCLFGVITLFQFIRNRKLNRNLKSAHNEIVDINKELELNYSKIQTLIKEVHHRVKNNMQIISSLLNLQSNDIEDEKVAAALNTSKSRIQSMALVHQKLYGNEDLTKINVYEYVDQLVQFIENSLSSETDKPIKEINISQDLYFNMNTMVPLGLILNELITNTYKYAFVNEKEKSISITVSKEEDYFQLLYADSGSGIPNTIDIKQSGTLGLELIHILTEQLQGKVEYNGKNDNVFSITFKTVL